MSFGWLRMLHFVSSTTFRGVSNRFKLYFHKNIKPLCSSDAVDNPSMCCRSLSSNKSILYQLRCYHKEVLPSVVYLLRRTWPSPPTHLSIVKPPRNFDTVEPVRTSLPLGYTSDVPVVLRWLHVRRILADTAPSGSLLGHSGT